MAYANENKCIPMLKNKLKPNVRIFHQNQLFVNNNTKNQYQLNNPKVDITRNKLAICLENK
jgi:hypothetical protein